MNASSARSYQLQRFADHLRPAAERHPACGVVKTQG